MVREVDHKKRQGQIMELVVRSYIQQGRPVSSEYLKETYALSFSTATLRNVMSELEDEGYLSHLHRSSGRIPTQEGFRHYVNFLMSPQRETESTEDILVSLVEQCDSRDSNLGEVLEEASRTISLLTHYTGLSFVKQEKERLFFWGTRYMLEEPEFEDVEILRDIFLVFEEKIHLFNKFLEENIKNGVNIFIGEEIGVEEIKNCSLIFSPLCNEEERRAFLGVLGPMRMDYSSVVSRLRSLTDYLEDEVFKRIEDDER